MTKLLLLLGGGLLIAAAGAAAGGAFAFFTSQDVTPDAVQVQASSFDLSVGASGTLGPLVISDIFPTNSQTQSFPIALDAAAALQASLKLGVTAKSPPTTAGFAGVLLVRIDVDGVPVYGDAVPKTLQDLEAESPVVVATVNGGDLVDVALTVKWPDGAPAVDNLYIGAQYQADVTVLAEQVVS